MNDNNFTLPIDELYPNLTYKQYEEYKNIADFIQWGRKNPVKFAEEIFGIELMDFQAYIIESTWTAERAVWCCSRNAGNDLPMIAISVKA